MIARLIFPILALLAGVFAAHSLVRNWSVAKETSPPSPPPVADFLVTIGAAGLIEPSTENIAVGTAVPGIVQHVFVKVGDEVEAGKELFQIDTRHLGTELAVRRAALATVQARARSAKITLDDAMDQLQRSQRLTAGNGVSTDELMRRQFAVKVAESRLDEAEAEGVTAGTQVKTTEMEIERSTVRAPVSGTVLQMNVRLGQFAATTETAEPLVVLGQLRPLHLRVDVDEYEGWRVREDAAAVAHVRGNANLKVPLKFVRFEPMVIPKRSLTGDSVERIDTRVLQVIYKIGDHNLRLSVGQQMDVFIEDSPPEAAKSSGGSSELKP